MIKMELIDKIARNKIERAYHVKGEQRRMMIDTLMGKDDKVKQFSTKSTKRNYQRTNTMKKKTLAQRIMNKLRKFNQTLRFED